MKSTHMLLLGILVLVVSIAVVRATGQEAASASEPVASDEWEYLAVAGPSTTNLTPTGNSRMRKEPTVPFAREAFVL